MFQNKIIEPIVLGEVISYDGLKIRMEDSVYSEKIGLLKYNEEVIVIAENGKSDFLHNKNVPSIIRLLKNGIPESTMVSYNHLGDEAIELLAKYIYSNF